MVEGHDVRDDGLLIRIFCEHIWKERGPGKLHAILTQNGASVWQPCKTAVTQFYAIHNRYTKTSTVQEFDNAPIPTTLH